MFKLKKEKKSKVKAFFKHMTVWHSYLQVSNTFLCYVVYHDIIFQSRFHYPFLKPYFLWYTYIPFNTDFVLQNGILFSLPYYTSIIEG